MDALARTQSTLLKATEGEIMDRHSLLDVRPRSKETYRKALKQFMEFINKQDRPAYQGDILA